MAGGAARPAVPELITALRAPETRVRRLAPGTLGSFGADARAAVPALEAALRDPDPEVRREAAYALLRINAALRKE